MEFRFVPAVALIQRQVEEDVLAKGSYSKLRIAFILSVQASAEQHFHKMLQNTCMFRFIHLTSNMLYTSATVIRYKSRNRWYSSSVAVH